VLNNPLPEWIGTEIDRIIGDLGDSRVSIPELSDSLKKLKQRLGCQDGSETNQDQASPTRGRQTICEDASPSPAPSERATFIRHTVTPEDSEWIEQVRSHTYAAAKGDDESCTPEAAMESGLFADDEMARRYLVEHLRRCIDAVEAGSIDDVTRVSDIAESLRILARELALEPGEYESDFEAFDGWGSDTDLLQQLGVTRNVEPDWFAIVESRESELFSAGLEHDNSGGIKRPVYHAAYRRPAEAIVPPID
jgi:hypothetical protein